MQPDPFMDSLFLLVFYALVAVGSLLLIGALFWVVCWWIERRSAQHRARFLSYLKGSDFK